MCLSCRLMEALDNALAENPDISATELLMHLEQTRQMFIYRLKNSGHPPEAIIQAQILSYRAASINVEQIVNDQNQSAAGDLSAVADELKKGFH